MTTSVPIPYFAEPPKEYDQSYFSQVTRAFALYTQQVNAAGPLRGTTLVLTNLPTSATGLESGSVWNDAGTLKVVP